ncbi:hypothetical protein [Stenotrophomonas rhizophila]|uniref:Relaxosome protein TraY n=1 Tax=Stenotrophomonas rhizophila TaxID=216778 RepID=A0AAW5PPD9_9GAMM|nr:hypothetical protein [Stenotrophomonas rhizophila]MCS4281568.1 hypothetical protein [Stenotrophomonas rhizophila]
MIKINLQLTELGELLTDIAKRPDGTSKQQMIDRILQNQDALFSVADHVRDALGQLGLAIPGKV